MADTALSPTFDRSLKVSHIEQINLRGQEVWGRWLLGHRSELLFEAPNNQQIALEFKLSLPYEGQWVNLVFNGTTIFRGINRSPLAGVFKSRLLVKVQQGQNKLEVLTNRSNRDGLGAPFAEKDSSDISVAVQQLAFEPVKVQAQNLYGPQPSSFIGPAYSSAGTEGLVTLFDRQGPLIAKYRVLRRFEHQGFSFDLDGTPVYRLPAQEPGNLLVGQFTITAAMLGHSNLHVLRIRSQPVTPSATPFLTTAQDNPEVQFYVQHLALENAAPTLQTNPLAFGTLGLLCAVGLWWMLFRPQRS